MRTKKRVIIKLSGEALSNNGNIYSAEILDNITKQLKLLNDKKIEIGIVVGGGNIFRGDQSENLNLSLKNKTYDYVGMTSTITNSYILSLALEKKGVNSLVQNILNFDFIKSNFDLSKIKQAFLDNEIVIFSGGTGKPMVSTDTAAAMRAIEVDADLILIAKNKTNGVYDKDPNLHSDAVHIPFLTFDEVIDKNLKVIDIEAMKLLKGKKIEIHLFNMNNKDSIYNTLMNDEKLKTIIGDTKNG